MDKNKDNVAVSALYTAATWHWAGLPGAAITTPDNAEPVFRVVNAYLRLYRWLNPQTYSLPHQLLHRHAAIDHLRTASGLRHTVEIASGFSPRGVKVSADVREHYLEIDLPDMVKAKQRQLAATPDGQAALARDNFRLQPGDITTMDFRQPFPGQPVCLISEGLMMYFPRARQLPIWRAMAERLCATGGVYLFDYIPLSEEPPRSLAGRLLHFLRFYVLRLRGDFAYDARDREAIAADLRACGFTDVTSFSTGEVAADWRLPQAGTPSRTLIYRCRIARPVGEGGAS